MSEKKEYIERGEAFAILRDASKQSNSELDKAKIAFAMVFLSQQPAADVEPVVRCKDCRRWHPTESDTPNERYCSFMGKFTRSSFYCGRAERSGSGE